MNRIEALRELMKKEGADSDVMRIGAHSSVAYGAYLPASLATNLRFVSFLKKATTRVRTYL